MVFEILVVLILALDTYLLGSILSLLMKTLGHK